MSRQRLRIALGAPSRNRDEARQIQSKILRGILKDRGISQAELARIGRLDTPTISRAVHGKCLLTDEHVNRLAIGLGLPSETLVPNQLRRGRPDNSRTVFIGSHEGRQKRVACDLYLTREEVRALIALIRSTGVRS